VATQASTVLGDKNVPLILKNLNEGTANASQNLGHLDKTAGDLQDEVHRLTHPTFWGKVQGAGLLGLDLASTAAQIHYYAADSAINVTTTATKSAVHKFSQHPAVTSPTHP
jgi:hypothetical protein